MHPRGRGPANVVPVVKEPPHEEILAIFSGWKCLPAEIGSTAGCNAESQMCFQQAHEIAIGNPL